MSKKPYIKIVYPEASEKALKLTEAMVKRSPGKRVVETESEDPIFPDSGDLFSSFIRCKTQTGVDLTLTLNSSSMDFALETLIRPNLNADERKQILGEDTASSEEALPGLAPTDDPTEEEQKKQIEVGKISEKELRGIISDAIDDAFKGHGTFDAIGCAVAKIKEIIKAKERFDLLPKSPIEEDNQLADSLAVLICGAQRVQPKKTTELRLFANKLALSLQESFDDEAVYIVTASELKRVVSDTQHDLAESPGHSLEAELEVRAKARLVKEDPSWDDMEKEARTIGQKSEPASEPAGEEPSAPAEKSAAPLADGDIDPGLLNDIEDKKEGGGE